LADAGDTDASFGHFRQGNALQRVGLAYNEAATLALLERARTVFTGDLLRRRAGAGDASVEPVFVVGMPRSGTTLVEQILASHPRAFGAGE
ncbi:sulfotransferase, partial [Staphylococcus aureus]